MKKMALFAMVAAVLVFGTSAAYADGWSTAGKVLTGVVAADILLNQVGHGHGHGHYGGYGGYGFSYGHHGRHHGYSIHYYSGPPVHYYPAPVYDYYRPAPVYRYPRHYRSYRCYP